MEFILTDFTGPLDLLLHLLQKNKMDIYDIEISAITTQYMDYVEQADTNDLEYMSDFLVMASTLLLIKSKMLLPHPKQTEEEDPRYELVQRLLEYKKIKHIVYEFENRQIEQQGFCFRNHEISSEIPYTTAEMLNNITLESLYNTYIDLVRHNKLVSIPKEVRINQEILKKDIYTIEQKSKYIMRILEERTEISFFDLCYKNMPKVEFITTFMCILELTDKSQISIQQIDEFGDILIVRR